MSCSTRRRSTTATEALHRTPAATRRPGRVAARAATRPWPNGPPTCRRAPRERFRCRHRGGRYEVPRQRIARRSGTRPPTSSRALRRFDEQGQQARGGRVGLHDETPRGPPGLRPARPSPTTPCSPSASSPTSSTTAAPTSYSPGQPADPARRPPAVLRTPASPTSASPEHGRLDGDHRPPQRPPGRTGLPRRAASPASTRSNTPSASPATAPTPPTPGACSNSTAATGSESVHNILDNAFDEDRLRIRTGHGPENTTRLRRFAIGVIRSHTDDCVAAAMAASTAPAASSTTSA